MVGKPNETVIKLTCLPRWQREWINKHRSLNYSGMVQEMLNIVINEYDPDYFEKYKDLIQLRMMKRKENVLQSIATIDILKL